MISKFRNIYSILTMGRKDAFYAVRTGRKTGIFRTWAECEMQVKGYPGARYKKFPTEEEAQQFVSGPLGSLTATLSKKRRLDDCDWSANQQKLKYRKPCLSTSSPSFSSVPLCCQVSSSDEIISFSRPVVYTDGCCSKNGRKGAKAGIGVYWGPEDKQNVSERLEGEQTNQRAEIMAAVKALEIAKSLGYRTLEIKTDSKYTINGATDWCIRWKKNGWKTVNGMEVKNKAEFQALLALCDKIDVKWTHVPGHQGVPGNEAADSLARQGAEKLCC